jgi:hypothetical protein
MHEPVEVKIANVEELKHVHRGQLWIDAMHEPCMVFFTDDPNHLRVALLENGERAMFPLTRAPAGTAITLTQDSD